MSRAVQRYWPRWVEWMQSRIVIVAMVLASGLGGAGLQAQESSPPTPNSKSPDAGNSEAPPSSPSPKASPQEPNTPKTQIPKPTQPKAKTPQTAARQEKEEEHEPADPDTGSSTLSDETLGILPNHFVKKGVKFSLSYIGETLANVSGGVRRGAIYDGRLNAAVDVDFKTLAGWPGLTFHANVFEIHGAGLSRNYVGNLMTVSGIEALATLRLYEIWFEQ